jgi:hypothetical protein
MSKMSPLMLDGGAKADMAARREWYFAEGFSGRKGSL